MRNGVGIGVLLLALSAGAGCSSQERDVDAAPIGANDGGRTDIVVVDAVAVAVDAVTGGPDATCLAPAENGPIAAGTCTSVITRCGDVPDQCSGARLIAVLRSDLTRCGITCGAVNIGFSGGCATTLGFSYGFDAPAASCLLDTLMQSRFDCAPADGWLFLSFGSCTLP